MPMTTKIAAEKVREAADKWEKTETDNEELKETYVLDAQDLRVLSHIIDRGDLRNAIYLASTLDTVVRDAIPGDVWEWLMENKSNS